MRKLGEECSNLLLTIYRTLQEHGNVRKQKNDPDCKFFAIRDCRETLNAAYSVKMQRITWSEVSFALWGSGENPQSKKSCRRSEIFVSAMGDCRDEADFL